MDNENETRPLLHSFQSETWRSRARKRCMRIPSEITITGIILGLFLIVVTLLIVLENMESDKKEKNISLDNHLLASPMKFNKKVEDLSWQDKKDYTLFKNKQMEEKSKKWDKVNKGWKQLPGIAASSMKFIKNPDDLSWPDKKDYMKFKDKQMEEKSKKWDKVNKGWKQLPGISASPTKFDKMANQSWNGIKDYMKIKQKKMEEKHRKLDKINNFWKKLPVNSDDIHDLGYEEKQTNLDDDVGTMVIGDNFDEYGKEIDGSLETFANLRMSSPSDMRKFREEVLEVKNLLHSNINWNMIDDGWKSLSEQGWREKDIRRALFMALNEKRQELKAAELQNLFKSPMNFGDIWDQINDSWKKNLHEGKEDANYEKIKGTNDEAKKHLNINEEWRKKDLMQSPTSDMKKFVKEDEGWKNLEDQGWKNKDIEEKLIKAWKDRENVMQSPLNVEDLWGKATDFLRNVLSKGKNNQKTQMETNDEWASKFNNLLQSSFKKKDSDEKKNKHSKDAWKDKKSSKTDDEPEDEEQMNFDDFSNIIQAFKDHENGMDNQNSQMEINNEFMNLLQTSYKKWKKNQEFKKQRPKDDTKDKNTDENEIDQLQQSPVNLEDFVEVIEAIREKGKKEAEKQKNMNDEMKNQMGTMYSSKPNDNRWKQIDDHFKTLIEYERNSIFGRNGGGGATSNPGDISLQKSMPFIHSKQDKMSKDWQKFPEEGIKEKDIKEAVNKAWKEGDKLRKSAFGHDSMKWKKVNDGWKKVNDEWKTISNKS